MIAKLYSKTNWCYQIYHKDGVLFSWISSENLIKQPHKAHKLKEDQKYTKNDENTNLDGTQNLQNENRINTKL